MGYFITLQINADDTSGLDERIIRALAGEGVDVESIEQLTPFNVPKAYPLGMKYELTRQSLRQHIDDLYNATKNPTEEAAKPDIQEPIGISVAEAAELIGVSAPTLRNYTHAVDFPALRLGGRVLVNKAGLIRWFNEKTAAGAELQEE